MTAAGSASGAAADSPAVALDVLATRISTGPWPVPLVVDVTRVPSGVAAEPSTEASRAAAAATVHVSAVTHDSRRVAPGTLFCCVRGGAADGHDFAAEAVARGAVALLVERPLDIAVPQLRTPDVRRALSTVAGALHGYPAQRMTLVAITGTNGKTTTAQLLGRILTRAGHPTAVFGTLSGSRTTAEATDLQDALAAEHGAGTTHVVMEVTSHALVLHRVAALHFDVAVFTNLTQDHLDFHPTMEDYFHAKEQLFDPVRAARAVVNGDDAYGRRLLASARVPADAVTMADATGLRIGAADSEFTWRGRTVHLRLGGPFNVANALEAAHAASLLGVDPDVIADALGSVEAVPGRFERVDAGQPFAVLVDYAHTPDALERVLVAARAGLAPQARLLTVFGCGGDRDRLKRPLMGEVAARLSDEALLTDDNPRSENPDAIVEQVLSGVQRDGVVRVVRDRRAAIAAAIAAATPGDAVVIAGKGHETGQDVAGVVTPFDDRAVARELLGDLP